MGFTTSINTGIGDYTAYSTTLFTIIFIPNKSEVIETSLF